MLSNNADQFMTTPMPTSVTTQATRSARQEMPAPRATSRTGFLPGLGEFLPGMNGYVSDQAYRGTGALNLADSRLWLTAAAGLGLWMLLRKPRRATAGRARRK